MENPGESIDNGPFAAMTVSERLYEAGLLDEFQNAGRSGDREAMIRLLLSVDITPRQAAWTVDECLKRPNPFGPWKKLPEDHTSQSFITATLLILAAIFVIVLGVAIAVWRWIMS